MLGICSHSSSKPTSEDPTSPSVLRWSNTSIHVWFHLYGSLLIEHPFPRACVLTTCRNQNINRLREFNLSLGEERVFIGSSGPKRAGLFKCAFCPLKTWRAFPGIHSNVLVTGEPHSPWPPRDWEGACSHKYPQRPVRQFSGSHSLGDSSSTCWQSLQQSKQGNLLTWYVKISKEM